MKQKVLPVFLTVDHLEKESTKKMLTMGMTHEIRMRQK